MTRGHAAGGARRNVAGVAAALLLISTVVTALGASPAGAQGDQTQATFTNPVPIAIPGVGTGPGNGSPYPSGIAVTGLGGSILDVNVTLNNLGHTWPDDIDVILVSPANTKVILMAEVGDDDNIAGVTLTFDQAATSSLPNTTIITSGTYDPTVGGSSITGCCGYSGGGLPAGTVFTTLNQYNGQAPNGTWNLFVYDDGIVDVGSIANGWTLNITTTAPTCTGFNPTSGGPGAPVVITGTNLTGATNVTFNGVQASVNVVNSTTINTTVPATATTGSIQVTTPAGTATCPGTFTVIPAPVITSFTPGTGKIGTPVTIIGTTFSGATSLTFNGVAAVIGSNSGTQITTTVPAGASTGPIAVTTASGTGTSAANFVVKHARSLTFSVNSPAKGKVSVLDGFNECRSDVPVKLQYFRNGQWRNVGTDRTNANGAFNFGPQNAEGRYRALAPKYTTSGDVCLKKRSPVDQV